MKIKSLLFLLFTFLMVLTFSNTNAKYYAVGFGDAFDIRFTKLTVFTEDFVIRDDSWYEKDAEGNFKLDENGNKIPVTEVISPKLWGIESGGKPDDCTMDDLKNVSFSVVNGTTKYITLGMFTVSLSYKVTGNADNNLDLTLTNTLTTNPNEQIKGRVSFNGDEMTSNYFDLSVDGTYNGNPIYDFVIDPEEYYKNVSASANGGDNWWETINTTEGINTFEEQNLLNYFVLAPGQAFEFNLNIDIPNGVGNNATYSKSYYTKVEMSVREYTGSKMM